MHRRYGLLLLLTAAVVLAVTYAGVRVFQPSGMPFSVNVVNSHTAVIVPVPTIPLPKAIEPGDRVDLAATPRSTRTAIGRQFDDILPVGRTYEFAIRHGRAIVTVPVTTVDASTSTSTGVGLWEWGTFCSVVLLGGIALLASWRGRDRAAAGLALWAIANVFGFAAGLAPLDGRLGLSAQLGSDALDLLARVGFYMMVESIAGTALTPRSRALWRASFLLLLGAGAVATLGGILVFIASGWAEFLLPQYGFVLTASYFVPVALLFANYRHADGAQRLRLRWMLWSSVVLVTSVFLYNTPLLGPFASDITTTLMLPIAMAGFLYAVLRYRVVDVSVVLNRALVYAATTSLVLGLFALLESLIERTTLGHDAGLLLELAVPLALGAALSTVHRRIEAIVERFFFRRQYRAEVALRRFAEECAFVTQPGNLFDLTVEQIARHAGAPRVALYERTPEAYVRIRQQGEPALPEQVTMDDLAFVGLRARNAEFDLDDTQSQLGRDGYAFPLMLRGTLLGALVVGQRPGEHYAADERELLFHVAHEVGAALFALRAQESETRALASEARSQASEARARTSEALLMETLRAVGSTART
ncbi:GAF domain-containing protein [Metallibacterium sp.]|uniref:GAF domain-containing protein n=1 Tax=Metallibacterium sp. TaxID=2940281 RepID=UPI00261E175C|nr:GAF domain-containing protein [Metallibacterium sp.]